MVTKRLFAHCIPYIWDKGTSYPCRYKLLSMGKIIMIRRSGGRQTAIINFNIK